MSFLTINGYEVLLEEEPARKVVRQIGDQAESYNGTLRGTRRAKKREWPMESALLTVTEAEALESFLLGEGHYWSFDSDLYSSKGLGPQAGYTATQSGSSGKYGGKVSITSIGFAAGLTDDWTVLVYRWDGSAWEYYAVRSDSAKWVDGTRNDVATTTWLSVDSAGDVNITGSPTDFDELIALPYLATADMITSWQALTVAFSDLPKLNCSGTALNSKTVECMGAEVRSRYIPFANSDGWQEAGQRVSFVLREA